MAKAIGIAWADPVCLNWVIKNVEPFKTDNAGTDYKDLNKDEQASVRDKTEELYLGYVMMIQSAAVNDKLKTDLHNNFTVKRNDYPASMQSSLHLLDKYSKQVAVQPVQLQGHSFVQGGRGSGRGGGRGRGRGRGDGKKDSNEPEDPAKWAGLICSRCGGKDHGTRVCMAPAPGIAAAASKSDDRSTRSSRSSRSSASSSSSKKSQLKSLLKEKKETKKQFAQIKEEIRELEDSDISGSSDESAKSFLIMTGTDPTKIWI